MWPVWELDLATPQFSLPRILADQKVGMQVLFENITNNICTWFVEHLENNLVRNILVVSHL